MGRSSKTVKGSARWDFLFDCQLSDYDGDPYEPRRMPKGHWTDDGEAYYVWSAVGRLGTAVRRAADRCEKLREQTGLDWRIDHDTHRNGSQSPEDIIDIGDHPLLKERDLLH